MNSNIKHLISLLEEEKVRLQELIDRCVSEHEYLLAHYHSEALYQVNGKLQTLNNIDDKLYFEKFLGQRKIARLQMLLEAESPASIKEQLEVDLKQEKEALEKLYHIKHQIPNPDNSNLLDQTLKKLLEKKIKNLKLILNKSQNLFLRFSYSKKELKVILPNVKQHTQKWTLNEENIEIFKYLGFCLSETESRLTLTLTGDQNLILAKLKLILGKIVFEIFYYKQFDNESFIQFTERSTH